MGRRIEPSWYLSFQPMLLQHRLWYVLSCQWGGAYKRTLAANRKAEPMWRQRVSSRFLNSPLLYVWCHITIIDSLIYVTTRIKENCIIHNSTSLMVRWVVGSILHGVDPLSYFSFQPVLHDWCNKGRGMWYPVCGMVHIKEPLLLIGKNSLCGGSRFPFSLSEWSLTI